MFGHLKAEDFTNLIENAALPGKREAHLRSCPRCQATFDAVKGLQAQMAAEDHQAAILEPDWADFRSSVRDAMLSRSVQRDSAIRRWTGLAMRPAMAWTLSIMFVVGLGAGMWVWNRPDLEKTPAVTSVDNAGESLDVEPASWYQGDVFDQLVQLKGDEVENLRQLLEAEQQAAPAR